jgi:hypothetical protein
LLIYTTYNHSTLIFSVYLHQYSRVYNKGTIKVSLNHTLPISLSYSTHKVFKSHVKSWQADCLYTSSTMNFPWLSPTENWLVPEPNEFCHLYTRGTDTRRRKHMSRDHHSPLHDVTADMENTFSSTVARLTVFTELLPGNALIKPVTVNYPPTYDYISQDIISLQLLRHKFCDISHLWHACHMPRPDHLSVFDVGIAKSLLRWDTG